MRAQNPKKQTKNQGFFLKYPGPTLAIVMISSVVFSVGATWATANARIQRLEEASASLASKEELALIKEMIRALNEKVDILVGRKN